MRFALPWKIACVVLLAYTVIMGFFVGTPILQEGGLYHTIRNLFFHVPMWFNMVLLFGLSCVHAVRYLRSFDLKTDMLSTEYAKVGAFFSVLGMITGMEWANYTWSGTTMKSGPWTGDPKQICAALTMLIYFALFVLRAGIKDEDKRGKIAAVYNVFAFALMIPLIFIIPKMVDSLHPGGSEGSPAMNPKHTDWRMRTVFYPAVIGWFLLGLWFVNIKMRMRLLQQRLTAQHSNNY